MTFIIILIVSITLIMGMVAVVGLKHDMTDGYPTAILALGLVIVFLTIIYLCGYVAVA